MIRNPSDSREIVGRLSSVSRAIPRRGFVQWAGYFRPIYFFRSKYPLASEIKNDLSDIRSNAAVFFLEDVPRLFSIFTCIPVYRGFFLSNVARRRSFRKRWLFIVVSFVLRLFLFIVRFFSFFTSSRCPTVHRRLTQRPGEYRKSLPASFFRP